MLNASKEIPVLGIRELAQALSDIVSKSDESHGHINWVGYLDVTAKIVAILANIAVVVVAVFALFQYYGTASDAKRAKSLEFVEEWSAKGLESSYDKISKFVELKRLAGDTYPSSLSPEAVAIAKYNLGIRWSRQNNPSTSRGTELNDSLDKIIQFFSRMSICARSEVCDVSVLYAYFDSELLTFWAYFSGYAEIRRSSGYRGYGSNVDDLVQKFNAMPPKTRRF